jgi:bifunctional enzyme CysN/CysC
MVHQSDLIAADIHTYLKAHEQKDMLRFITCGSVDDGKSTLIGRLLWDSKLIFEDQLASLEEDSKRVGTQNGAIDYALLLDGLQAEREQGITIDVAYRFFSTTRRKFIVADTPGHEQYTRNMVTGASTAQVAVILIDARKGLLAQSRRHSYLASVVGIRHIVLAINKMDLVDYNPARFELIRKEYELFAASLGFEQITAIPLSALNGDNVMEYSSKTPWYTGPTLLEHLETVVVNDRSALQAFRMRIQWVNRPHHEFRGYCGTIASGTLRPGDLVSVNRSGVASRVERIITFDGDLDQAVAGQAVTLTLSDEIDISRGDLLATPEQQPHQSDHFLTRLVWLHEQPSEPGRNYLLKAGAATVPVRLGELKHKVNINDLQPVHGHHLTMNEVGSCELLLGHELACDRYRDNRSTGSFILIDRQTNATVAAGMIEAPLTNIDNSSTNQPTVNKEQGVKVFWFNGLPQQKVAAIEAVLRARGLRTHLLNEETMADLNREQGRPLQDPIEIGRRTLAVAEICAQAGLIVFVAAEIAAPTLNSRPNWLVSVEAKPEANPHQLAAALFRDHLL